MTCIRMVVAVGLDKGAYLFWRQLDDSLSIRIEHILLATQQDALENDLDDFHGLAVASQKR